MESIISIAQFIRSIRGLASDEPKVNPRVWYTTQKEHWLGWLSQYHGPGAYGRLPDKSRDAKFAYNHIVNPKMLLWLVEAAGVEPALVARAKRAALRETSLPGKSKAVREHVPWSTIYAALWG